MAALLAWVAPTASAQHAAAPLEDDEPSAGDQSAQGCTAEPVSLQRLGLPAPIAMSLTDCAGHPNLATLSALSALAQPESSRAAAVDPDSTEARQLNPELLVRLQRIADGFPGHAIEIVSGYRPRARPGSRHHSGDALDLRVEGVDNTVLVTLLRSLAATGVGYYPNSTFVHVDVRANAFYWADRSAPGEAPSYVAESATERPAAVAAATAGALQAQAATATPDADTETSAGAQNEPSPSSQAHAQEPATDAQGATEAELDAELRNLAERALLVMNLALGRTLRSDSTLPDRAEL
jgi:hypothetical protein